METLTIVVNIRHDMYDVYIGRPSIWGNPYIIGKHGDREEVIQKYKTKIMNDLEKNPELKDQLKELKGKVLGCYCWPEACHGDVLIDLINSY